MGEIVIAAYRPREGKSDDLKRLIDQHVPALLKAGLITSRPSVLCRAADGTFVEVFEWKSEEASKAAHENPDIGKIWGEMQSVSDFITLNQIEESGKPFPHFTPMS